ncbi:MAG: hypothetical protein HFJ86_04800 [Oscillospiraceae bacterium]|nr:hypothetical protein [Oscillospiraceae bacterium]
MIFQSPGAGNGTPKKEDKRLIGKPGDKNETYDLKGNLQGTKAGEGGFATKERHHSDHGYPDKHSILQAHDITWEGNRPKWGAHKITGMVAFQNATLSGGIIKWETILSEKISLKKTVLKL